MTNTPSTREIASQFPHPPTASSQALHRKPYPGLLTPPGRRTRLHSVDENKDVLVSVGGPAEARVGLLTLNRPKAINSLTHPMVGTISRR